MEIIYSVSFHGDELRNGKFYPVRIPVASFFKRADAQAFAKAENDEVECEVMEVEETPLVGLYGDLIEAKDFPQIFGHLIGE